MQGITTILTVEPASPIITLLTDFGLKDHYVGTMKGVISAIAPLARLIDISHEIPPFSVHEGAYALAQSAPFFPAGTVHLVVVDPGVGTERRAILAEANNQLFVAPDNGVLTLVLRATGYQGRELTNQSLWRPSPSSTFHGRDIFAPVAAALAGGKARPEDVGPVIQDLVLLPNLAPVCTNDQIWRGVVLSVDRFGNVITNFPTSTLLGGVQKGFLLRAGTRQITRVCKTFGSASAGELFVYAGSSGYLEIGINQASAAATLDVHAGEAIELHFPK
jgi:S-adenosylmethionine hydrolase